MTVIELREILEQLPDDTEIIFKMPVGCCGEEEVFAFDDEDSHTDGYLQIYFKELDYLNSCRKYGNAVRGGK